LIEIYDEVRKGDHLLKCSYEHLIVGSIKGNHQIPASANAYRYTIASIGSFFLSSDVGA